MTKKRMIAVMLALAMVLTMFTGCGDKEKRNISYIGDVVDKDTLVICVDALRGMNVSSGALNDAEIESYLKELQKQLKRDCGIEKIAFQLLPYGGAEREMALQRLRTEIMAGSGPDVFLMRSYAVNQFSPQKQSSLFTFPEKNMEAGLFLPLDTYMENNTRFTDWSAQTQAVLNAGRSDEGQVVVPLTYEFLFLMYPREEANIPYTTDLTRREILDDPETAELGTLLYSNILKQDEKPAEYIWKSSSLLPSMLGELADYETDELRFTEDELVDLLTETLALYDEAAKNEHQYMKNFAGYNDMIYEVYNAYFDTDMAMLPMYTKDGGVAASINAFAAVNRNTRHPEESFAVIDYIMQEDMQRKSEVYSLLFYGGLPLQNDLGSQQKPLRAKYEDDEHMDVSHRGLRWLDDPYFEDLLSIKDQITAVNFATELDGVLSELVRNTHNDGVVLPERVSEAYETMKRMMGE